MSKWKKNDDDNTREYFEEENDFNEFDGFEDDETEPGTNNYEMDDDKTILTGNKAKPEILGFIVIKKGKRKNDKFDLTKEDVIIGRSNKCCDIVLDDEDISRIHCRIRKESNSKEFHFYDCGSTNGTTLNGEEVHHKILKSHDKITLGETVELVFIQV